jgi:carboxymethylenebutenolidase
MIDRRPDRASSRIIPIQMKRILSIFIPALLAVTSSAVAQDAPVKRLESPLHHQEWVRIPVGGKTLHAFVVYPRAAAKTPAVIVIHENLGLTDWVREFADELAGEGVIAITPDLLSGNDPAHDRTSDFPSADAARKALYLLDPQQTTRYLLAAQKYVSGIPSFNGKLAVIGFCWGGSEAFRFATHGRGLSATLVFYGMAPTPRERMAEIEAPVFGFYGGADNRVTSTIPETRDWMKKFKKAYEPVTYEGADHAFMRRAEEEKGPAENKRARDLAWKRIRTILSPLK